MLKSGLHQRTKTKQRIIIGSEISKIVYVVVMIINEVHVIQRISSKMCVDRTTSTVKRVIISSRDEKETGGIRVSTTRTLKQGMAKNTGHNARQ